MAAVVVEIILRTFEGVFVVCACTSIGIIILSWDIRYTCLGFYLSIVNLITCITFLLAIEVWYL